MSREKIRHKNLLDVEGLSVSFGGSFVVKNVSFSLKEGEVLCVVGESGSGKSLSALAIMGLLPEGATVESASLKFAGQELSDLFEESRRRLRGKEMGMVFQEPMTSLNPVLTVGKQVAEVFEAHTALSEEEIYAEVIELFKKVKLPEPERRYHEYPFQLSGGQRQRVMIAMALALKPKLLIADEPTTALDVTVQGEILKLMNELKEEMGMAVLFITHDFGVVKQMADNVAVMQLGEVVESADVKQIMKSPQHPYTKKLLEAMPKLRRKFEEPEEQGVAERIFLKVEALNKAFEIKKGGFFGKKEPFQALKNVSFTMNKGETLGIVGESGCGKSTLARSLVRLHEVDGGTIIFRGENTESFHGKRLRDMRRHMQMVFQDPFSSLNPRMKVGEIVGEGVKAHGLMSGMERNLLVRNLLRDCGLPEDAVDRYPHQFSGGQRQRIGIARALALRPALIVADEPVSALDVSVQKQILELMASLKKRYELSYIFISHDLRVVSQIADHVLVMKDGEVVEHGTAEQVFKKPIHPYTKQLLSAIPKG